MSLLPHKSFEEIKEELIQQTAEYVEDRYGTDQIQKLRDITDPRAWVKYYMRLTGAETFDIPDGLVQYLD